MSDSKENTTKTEEKKEIEWNPKYDIINEDKQVQWKIYIPGVSTKSLDISVDSKTNTLHLSGIKELNITEEIYSKVYGIPIPEGKFKLEIPYEKGLDFDNYNFDYSNGVLLFTVIKKNKVDKTKKVLLKKGSIPQKRKEKDSIAIYPTTFYDDIFDLPYKRFKSLFF